MWFTFRTATSGFASADATKFCVRAGFASSCDGVRPGTGPGFGPGNGTPDPSHPYGPDAEPALPGGLALPPARTAPGASPVPPAGRDAPPAARLPATAPRPVRSLNTKLTTIKPRASCHERGKTRGRSGSLRDGQPDRDPPLRHRWAGNSGRGLWRGLTGSRARSTGSIPRPNNGQGSTASAIASLARSLRGTIPWTDGAATEGGQVPGAIQSAPGVDRPS